MTVAVLATLDARAGEADALREALLRLATGTGAEPGTELFDVHEVTDSPGSYVVFERYRDPDAMAAHRNGPAVARFRSTLRELGIAPAIVVLTPLHLSTPTADLTKGPGS